jgi:ubiquinone/menaquinone biosynthesis C-methylase UbiE
MTQPGPRIDANAVYALGHDPEETDRLRRQADELRPESAQLLDRVGIGPGWSAVDLGCGPRGILELLSERVAPGGRVVGVDADTAHTALAQRLVEDRRLPSVEIVVGDARDTGLPPDSFDLVHCRTLLVNVPEPEAVVAEMVRVARPGRVVATMEPDTEYSICYPPSPAFDRIGEIFRLTASRNGADPWIGRRVPELFRDAGLVDVEAEASPQIYPLGHSRRTLRLELVRSVRPKAVEMGLATGEELDELDRAARSHLDNPRTFVMFGFLMLTWGRKPG